MKIRKALANLIYPEGKISSEIFEQLERDLSEGHLSKKEKELLNKLKRRVGNE